MLSPETVQRIIAVLEGEVQAFVVGAHALNLWAERYSATNPALADLGPFTSKDIDYFEHREAAARLAERLTSDGAETAIKAESAATVSRPRRFTD